MTSTHRRPGHVLGVAFAGVLAVGILAGTPSASAATQHDVRPLSAQQAQAATAAATTGGARSLLATASRGAAARQYTTLRSASPRIATHGTAIYALSPAFVSGKSETVGTLWYVATTASTSAGPMTVFTAPDPSGTWRAVNVATGDTEARMAAAAHGAALLLEPQVDAWYAVAGARVRPLNEAGRQVVGNKPVSVVAYQHIVHTRYSDKQANSNYAKRGAAGGFSASAAPLGDTTASGDSRQIGLAATGGLMLAGALGFGVERRRRARG